MSGQGRPPIRSRSLARGRIAYALIGPLLPIALALCAAAMAEADDVDIRLRLAWGGGEAQSWQGKIQLSAGTLTNVTPLGLEADSPGSMLLVDGATIRIAARTPRSYDGCDIRVQAPADAKLIVRLWAGEMPPAAPLEVPLAKLLGGFAQFDLDQRNNRLLAQRSSGDTLRVKFDRQTLIFEPGDTFELEALPNSLGLTPGASYLLAASLLPAHSEKSMWNEDHELKIDANGQSPQLPVRVLLPTAEGVYDVRLSLYSKRLTTSLVRGTPLATRKVQVVVIAPVQAVSDTPVAWQSVLDFDPASPKWWERMTRLPAWARLPNLPQQPVLSGPAGQRTYLNRPWIEIPPRGWQAYPLAISTPGSPHVLEVEYPSDVEQTLGISLVEPNSFGHVGPIGLDSGIDVPAATAGHKPQIRRHRLTCWPQTRTPWLLLANRRTDLPALVGKINVLAGPAELPALKIPQPNFSARTMAAYYDKPLFVENFSATEAVDAASGRSFRDWMTFYSAGQRLMQTLRQGGYNTLVLTVACEGSAIYPSQLLGPTPKYDTGTFFESGQDPVRKDVLELLLRLCDRNGIQLIPAVSFTAPLPELEPIRLAGGPSAVGLEPIGPDGRTWISRSGPRRGLGVYYNPLDERVQRAMTAVVAELAERYGSHASFGGVAVHLGGEGYALLPDETCSYDDVTVARFAAAMKTTIPPSPADATPLEVLEGRRQFFHGAGEAAWLEWRAAQMTGLFRDMHDEVTRRRPEAKLLLTTAGLLDSPALRLALRPALPTKSDPAGTLLMMGLAPQRLEEMGIVVPRPQRVVPAAAAPQRDLDRHWNTLPGLDAAFSRAGQAAALHFLEPAPLRLPEFDAASPFGAEKTRTLLLSQIVPADGAQRERFVRSLAALDAPLMIDGGWLLPLGQEAPLAPLVKVFRRLPAERFETPPPPKGQNRSTEIVVRTLVKNGKTYFYAVNLSPWPITAQIILQTPRPANLLSYSEERPAHLQQETGQATWTVAMEAFDLVGGEIVGGDAKIVDWRVTSPADAAKLLGERIRDVRLRTNAWPPPMKLANPSFEVAGKEPIIPRWVFGSVPEKLALGRDFVVEVDRSQASAGAGSLHLVSRTDAAGRAPIVWVRSEPFVPRATGRLRVIAAIRVADVKKQPKLRLAIEGKLDGMTYYRPAKVGALEIANGPPLTQLTTQWADIPVHLDDLPLAGLTDLRVGFDLMGEGEVWIDDVRVYDLWFESPEWHELLRSSAAAEFRLRNGQLFECSEFTESYWPSFLRRHVSLDETHPAPPMGEGPPLPGRITSQPAPAGAPAKESPPTTTWQRMQNWVPAWPKWR